MILLGALVNGAAVILGSIVGLIFNKGLSEHLSAAIMNALALCVLYIGISGSLKGENMLITILSMVFGTLIGEGLDLDGKVNKFGEFLDKKLTPKKSPEGASIAKGFITASMMVCVGAMAIVGPLQSGLSGDHSTLFAKSLLDGIGSLILASSLGGGVLLSGILVVFYEGSIALFANVLAPLLTASVVNEITCVGSLLIISLALNILNITNLKVMNYSPAMFLPIIFGMFM